MGTADGRVQLWHLLAATTGLTGLLIVLGVYTAASGSGLACAQQWPLCDGSVLPQTLPSFVEWLHRLVAMVTGLAILGSAAAAVRWSDDRRVTALVLTAVVLLPVQVGIGAVTVTIEGMFPWGYSTTVHLAHLLAALGIYTSLLLSTVVELGSGINRLSRLSTASGAATTAVMSVPFARGIGFQYTVEAQAVHYVLLLATLTLVVLTLWPRQGDEGYSPAQAIAGLTLPMLLMQLLIARDVALFTGVFRMAYHSSIVLTVLALATVVVLTRMGGGR